MFKIGLFAFALLATALLAIYRGQKPERIAAAMMSVAFVVSALLPETTSSRFDRLYLELFKVDAGLFVGLLLLALVANRYWPMWLAALQLLTLGVHLVKVYDPTILPIVYARVSGEIGYPMLVLLVIGIGRAHRRLKINGAERDWSVGEP